MQEEGIDVLLITDPANMNYLSGYDAWTFYVGQMLIVMVDEQEPIWIGRDQDINGARLTTWMSKTHIIPCPEAYYHAETTSPMVFIADFLHQHGQSSRTIGVEMDTYYFTASAYQFLKEKMPHTTFKNAGALVNWVRLIKSEQEIEYMKRAATLVEKAMTTGVEMIEPGVRANEVAAEIYYTLINGTKEYGGDYPAGVPLLPSGEDTTALHLTWSDRQYKADDYTILKLAGCYHRYHSPLSRTVTIGETSDEIKETAAVCEEGLHEALEAVKPGTTCEEIESAWYKKIESRGTVKDSYLGYSIGANYPPDWGGHTANLRKGDRTMLQPNMTFHMIPRLWIGQLGVEMSETFRVTETGYETLTDYERKLFVK
ncbi:Xaa-Pro dipeptidase [Natribacillus halophilus]|uniref:Xaa-Pro dipeptidase n=2 Tax=Natribacillus halophilus TaxID=549003 RepID=A0A1G8KBZ0_9BACI|nr:Xaa-Pro dipeptidase [Natribacillus halophilus]